MFRGAIGVVSTCACLAVVSAQARVVHFSGFEGECSSEDLDGDRLSGCRELSLKLDPASRDTDGDGLLDGDEVLGTLSGLDLPAMGVDPRRKNILMEYDWFNDALTTGGSITCSDPGGHSHRPTQAALDMLTVAFAAAPVANPDGSNGIDMVHDVGQGGALTGGGQVPEGDGVVQGSSVGAEYFQYYQQHFLLNRRGYFHYVLLPHSFKHSDGLETYSGSAQYADGYRRDRIMVSLACNHTDKRAAHTIMHEAGHNLGLMHGGNTHCNRKPNYNSILNYRYQFAGVDVDCDRFGDGAPDFSRGLRAAIDESMVDERKGVCGDRPIDFTGANGIEAAVAANLNKYEGELAECGAELSILKDHDDWGSIDIGVDASVSDDGGKPGDDAVVCGGE